MSLMCISDGYLDQLLLLDTNFFCSSFICLFPSSDALHISLCLSHKISFCQPLVSFSCIMYFCIWKIRSHYVFDMHREDNMYTVVTGVAGNITKIVLCFCD